MGIFHVLRRMHFNPILVLLAIARLAEVDWDKTSAEWFPFDYERAKLNSKPPVLGVTRTRANRTEVTEGSHDAIRPVYR